MEIDATTSLFRRPPRSYSPSQARLGTLEELLPDRDPGSLSWNHFQEASDSGTENPSLATSAMLSFQQTMQAFLQTQQEVMTAYLEGSVDASTESPAELLEPEGAGAAAAFHFDTALEW